MIKLWIREYRKRAPRAPAPPQPPTPPRPVPVAAPQQVRAPEDQSSRTLLGGAPPAKPRHVRGPELPKVERAPSLHPDAYVRTGEGVRVTAPELSDRKAVAQELIDFCNAELAHQKFRKRSGRLNYECARLYEMPFGQAPVARHGVKKPPGLTTLTLALSLELQP